MQLMSDMYVQSMASLTRGGCDNLPEEWFMHLIPANQTVFSFRPDAEPVLRVRPGEIIRFETSPEPVERLFAAGADWTEVIDVRAINAVTGPVFIEGVMPGDAVSVAVLAIEPRDWGWNAAIQGFGLLDGLLPEQMLERLPIQDGEVIVSDRVRLPLRPMIGCLGLAPAQGATSSLSPAMPWAGNYDLTQIAPGATVLFPAQVPGGLFSLGDLHAAMGEHEATFIAIECAGSATVRLDVRAGMVLETPRIETPDRIFVIGLSSCGDYSAARLQAARLLYELLTVDAELTPREAYVVISARGDLTLGGPAGTIVLGSVPRAIVDRG
jgi:amidase